MSIIIYLWCHLLGLRGLACLPRLFHVTCKPHCREQKEGNACADSTGVVGPGSGQEAGVTIMTWRYDRDCGRAREVCPSGKKIFSSVLASSDQDENDEPLAFPVNHELEDTMPVWCAEGDRVLSRNTSHRWEGGADVGVEHRKLELEVINSRVRLPSVCLGVEFGNVDRVFLKILSKRHMRG